MEELKETNPSIQISGKTIFWSLFIVLSAVFLYSVKSVLTPFILGGIFAYLLSPLVNFLTAKTKLPRIASVGIIYIIMVIILIIVATNIGRGLAKESRELTSESESLTESLMEQVNDFPVWSKPIVHDISTNLNFNNILNPGKIWPYFSGAITGLISFFIFLIASFYFLKDGSDLISRIANIMPFKGKVDSTILLKKSNQILSDYLRGQFLLVVLMASLSWIVLTILHVKYALIIGIFTGFAEIVPFVGPWVAGIVAVSVSIFDGVSSFGLSPVFLGIIVALIYFILRQFEDLFVIPHVLGHATKLHPLIILFAVLAGGHLWGILGTLLAVPIAALLRIFFEYAMSKME